jgi:hypothetical protein
MCSLHTLVALCRASCPCNKVACHLKSGILLLFIFITEVCQECVCSALQFVVIHCYMMNVTLPICHPQLILFKTTCKSPFNIIYQMTIDLGIKPILNTCFICLQQLTLDWKFKEQGSLSSNKFLHAFK